MSGGGGVGVWKGVGVWDGCPGVCGFSGRV